MTKSRRRSTRRSVGLILLEVIITLGVLFLMINFVLPWAAESMADGFVSSIEESR